MSKSKRRVADFVVLMGAVVLFSGLTACGGDDEGSGGVDIPGWPTDICVGYGCQRDGGDDKDIAIKLDGEPSDVLNWPEVLTDGDLHFVQEQGGDGQSCVGREVCTLIFDSIGAADIPVRFTEDGVASAGALIQYRILGDDLNQTRLEPGLGLASTLEDGETNFMQLRVGIDIEGPLTEDELDVEVSVKNRPDVGIITFHITIDPKPLDPLVVMPDYLGRRNVLRAQVWLFKQVPDPANPGQYLMEDAAGNDISCRAIEGFVRRGEQDYMPSSMLSSGEVDILRSVIFKEDVFDAVAEDENEQMYTVLGVGMSAEGIPLSVGCDDENALVVIHHEPSQSKFIHLILEDLWPRLSGTYTVISTFDLVSGLPNGIREVVYFIVDFFEDPAMAVLGLLCNVQSGVTDSMCDWVFDEDPEGNLVPSFGGGIVLEIINAIIYGLGEGNTWGQILTGGYDVGQILTNTRMQSTMRLSAEPDFETGELPDGSTSEIWTKIKYRWTLDMDPVCQADPDCGWTDVSFNAIADEAVTGSFTGRVNVVAYNGNAPGTLLTIDKHPLNIRYGQLVNYLFLNAILPRLAGPMVDTWEELFKTMLSGYECLEWEIDGNPNTPTCCEHFVDSVMDEAGNTSWLENILDSGCNAVVEFGALYVEALLTDQDAETGETFRIGTEPGNPCLMYDFNDDLIVDALGNPADEDEHCHWEASVGFIVGTYDIDATFYGSTGW